MDSNNSSLLLSSSSVLLHHQKHQLDSSFWEKQIKVPKQFIWPKGDLVEVQEELNEPLVDLEGFFKGDEMGTQQAARRIREACLKHGFFQVINHGVDSRVLSAAYDQTAKFFKLPPTLKSRVKKIPEATSGYASSHTDRFSSKLPWKETLSIDFHENSQEPVVVNYFKSHLGEDFEQTGLIFQKYSEAMKCLSLGIMELLAISLGVDRFFYRNFFEDCCALVRCNFYPVCKETGLTLGTGPHRDPTSLTILYQDEVGGLDVFTNNKWMSVRPRPGALVINIGETFTALSNGIYKSCLHRAVVNTDKERISLAFFVNPRDDKVVIPPSDLLGNQGTRMYPDFTWSDLLRFTQFHYRADSDSLKNFTKWFLSSKSLNP
ncbi:hypothetical protein Patl1_08227 [Pistacia atlantica]|uniref:Uncharacterized protein n=1 Tax=Pistacia atlantica TaxID=434234 RepID=A0ACC1AJM6_9ROSI|nr:hypothetical protein Patl1_08227 [Pistacia atlantica]